MNEERCPVCDLSEMGKRMDGFRECPECGAILSVENLARLRATREAELAEAVKPWREFVASVFSVEADKVGWRGHSVDPNCFRCEFCGAEHLDCYQIPHTANCPVTRARALLTPPATAEPGKE